MKFASKLLQRGVTLFEVLLVLFVGAFIAIAVATIYSTVQTNYKESVLFNDAQTLSANIHNLFASTGNYSGMPTQAQLITAGLVPSSMVTSTNTATNIFGGSWSVATAANTNNFTLTLTGLPSAACVSFASSALAVAVSVSANSNTVNSAGTAVTSCTAAGSTNSVIVTYS